MEKLNVLIKKFCTKEVISYGIFGVLTTLVNWAVFSLLIKLFSVEENIANAIAIIVAVLFAYFTNKNWVFHSGASNFKEKLLEFCRFILGRAFTMVVEFLGGMLMFKFVPIPATVSKLIITVVVIILNFFISKFFSFKSTNNN